MSGDVQPRKRKDKKRKKDDLGVAEPRGTAAALGDGDVFMHSQHDHGTGGHWCAKVVFFSLLAILVALVGLIILENRGLSELEANAVQSQYSGVLEGWLEDAPEDDHHDEHTLELNHHDDENDADHGEEVEHSDEAEDDAHDEENDSEEPLDDEADDDEECLDNDEDLQDNEEDSQEQDLETNDEVEDLPYRKYYHGNEAEPTDEDDDDDKDDNEQENDNANDDEDYDEQENDNANDDDDEDEEDEDDDDDQQLSNEFDQDEDNDDEESNNQVIENDDSQENDDDNEENDVDEYDTRENEADSQENNNEDDEDHDEDEKDTSLEVEKIEQEPSEEEPISTELPALPEPDDDDAENQDKESVEDDVPEVDDADEPDDFLEADDDEPPVERITAPAGKPFTEVEEETSSEKPTDTLAEEDEYEKRQEELRREEAQASHMWLKLSIGGALLVATHAIVRRATASSDVPQTEARASREETPIDRRMTLIPEEPTESVPIRKVTQESTRPLIQNVTKQIPSIVKSSPTFEESEEEVEEEEEEQDEPVMSKVGHTTQSPKQAVKEELYSDEEEDKEIEKNVPSQAVKQPTPEPESEEDVPDDVEIIEDEQVEEEVDEEDEDEEEISDVDDEELLTRLEAKYGRLPEPERPQRRKDGGNSVEDDWPGEPSDAYWRQQLDQAEREFNQGAWLAAADRASAKALQSSARARLLTAKALDAAAEKKRDNTLLGRAIAAYLELLKMNERLSDKKLLQVTERTINRIQFRGNYLNAEPVYRLLIRRFPDDPSHRTNLTVLFLMANRADLAEDVLKETLKRWPDDRLALAQYGFVLKTQHNRFEEAVEYLQRALAGDIGPATEPRFYYHLGDTLLLLGRFDEAHEVHKRGAAHGHFLSPAQRSLYNVPRLEGRPWWAVEDTPYVKLARALEKSWEDIMREGEAAKALYEQEKEGLKERGEWSQLDLFVRGREIAGRCQRAPVTCSVVKEEAAAAGCRRGQIKFSAMEPGTHVRPHVGPTNCRLRMHLGLTNTKDTFIRVDQETRQWKAGEVLIFDDSFEHEVWHNGTGSRLVLIVDVWHPGLTSDERRQLPAI